MCPRGRCYTGGADPGAGRGEVLSLSEGTIVERVRRFSSGLLAPRDDRSLRIRGNIFGSLLFQGVNVAASLALVPLTLRYLNPAQYGIWLTVGSVIAWFSIADLGLGNGLRNRFAEAVARGDRPLARRYVSTAYAAVGLIVGGLYLLFLGLYKLVPWDRAFNAPPELAPELAPLVLWVFTLFCLRFVLQLVTVLLTADQRPAVASGLGSLGNLLVLAGTYALVRQADGSLVKLGAWSSLAPVLVLAGATVVYFAREYREFLPSLRTVSLSHLGDLVGLGGQFFLIQLSGLALFSVGPMAIAHLLGPEVVTPYGVVGKYFGVPLMVLSLVVNPYWSAFTEAHAKREGDWVRGALRGLAGLWALFGAGVVVLAAVALPVIELWLGAAVSVPPLLVAATALLTIQTGFNTALAMYLNGTGMVRLQLYGALLAAFVNVPLTVYLVGSTALGVSGVAVAGVLALLPATILTTRQVQLSVQGRARGIWAS